jgi:hypothetical protein
VLDCENYTKFSSTIKDISIWLLMVVAGQNNMMTTDVANAFCTAPCMEKIWSITGMNSVTGTGPSLA